MEGITDILRSNVSQQLGLVVAAILGGIWAVKWVLRQYRAARDWVASVAKASNADEISRAIHDTLHNGIRQVIREETTRVVDDAIRRHEAKEREELDRRLAALHVRRGRR